MRGSATWVKPGFHAETSILVRPTITSGPLNLKVGGKHGDLFAQRAIEEDLEHLLRVLMDDAPNLTGSDFDFFSHLLDLERGLP